MSRDIPNASEMGRIGGRKRFEQIGSEGMAAIGAKGRASIRKNDPDFYKRLSLAGIQAREVKKQLYIKSQIVDKYSVNKLTKILTGS